VPGLDFIAKLKPVTYNFDTQKFSDHVNKTAKVKSPQKILPNQRPLYAPDSWRRCKICKDLGYNFDGLHIPDAANPTDNYGLTQPVHHAHCQSRTTTTTVIENQKNRNRSVENQLEKYKNSKIALKL
jgi:hypothetical protein